MFFVYTFYRMGSCALLMLQTHLKNSITAILYYNYTEYTTNTLIYNKHIYPPIFYRQGKSTFWGQEKITLLTIVHHSGILHVVYYI